MSECTPWDIPRVTCIFLVYTQAFLGKCVHKENASDKWDIYMLLAGWEVCVVKNCDYCTYWMNFETLSLSI